MLIHENMKRAKTEPESQGAQEGQEQAGAINDDQPFYTLPDEVVGLIWRKLDQRSQHNFMIASKEVARSKAVLSQIELIREYGGYIKDTALEGFPKRALLRRVHVDGNILSFVRSIADDGQKRQLVRQVQELHFLASAGCMGCCSSMKHCHAFQLLLMAFLPQCAPAGRQWRAVSSAPS